MREHLDKSRKAGAQVRSEDVRLPALLQSRLDLTPHPELERDLEPPERRAYKRPRIAWVVRGAERGEQLVGLGVRNAQRDKVWEGAEECVLLLHPVVDCELEGEMGNGRRERAEECAVVGALGEPVVVVDAETFGRAGKRLRRDIGGSVLGGMVPNPYGVGVAYEVLKYVSTPGPWNEFLCETDVAGPFDLKEGEGGNDEYREEAGSALCEVSNGEGFEGGKNDWGYEREETDVLGQRFYHLERSQARALRQCLAKLPRALDPSNIRSRVMVPHRTQLYALERFAGEVRQKCARNGYGLQAREGGLR